MDIQPVGLPHPDQDAVPGHSDAAGIRVRLGVPQAQVFAQRPEECPARVQKLLLRAVGAALVFAPDVGQILAQQLGQLPHILFL